MINQSRLKELLHYNPATGDFTWLVKRGCRAAGQSAGSIETGGRIQIRISGGRYFAHRLAWLYVYDRWPVEEIDHIDRDPTNNRLANLREVTHRQNLANQTMRKHNTSGVKCVSFDKNRGKYMVQISGKYGGRFKKLSDAEVAARAFRKELHGKFAVHA